MEPGRAVLGKETTDYGAERSAEPLELISEAEMPANDFPPD